MAPAQVASATFRIPVVLPSQARCAACVHRLCKAVSDIAGVSDAECDSRTSAITVIYDPILLAPEELEKRVRELGLEIAGRAEHAAYRVTGLD